MPDPIRLPPSDLRDPAIQTHPPGDRPDVRAGLACHPGQLAPFEKTLTSALGKTALAAATRALTVVHQSLGDMHAADDAMKSQRPEDRIVGPKGNVIFVVPESRKQEVRDAMAMSFGSGSKELAEAERVINESESLIQKSIDLSITNTRRNDVSVSAVASEIRSLVKNLPPTDRMAWVSKQIADHDLEAVSAILNSHPAVSGFDRKEFQMLREEAERQFSPDNYGERAALRALRERNIQGAGNHYLARLQSIIPVPKQRSAEGDRALKKLREGI